MTVAGSEGFVGDASRMSPKQEELGLMLFDSYAFHSALKLINLLIDKFDWMVDLSGIFWLFGFFADLFLLFFFVLRE